MAASLLNTGMDLDTEDSEVFYILDHHEAILNGKICPPSTTITYSLYNSLLEGLRSKSLNIQETLPGLLSIIDTNIVLPSKISNLTRKVQKHLNSGGDKDDVILSIYCSKQPDLPDEFLNSNVSYENLINKTVPLLPKPLALKNKHILFLYKILRHKNLPWSYSTYWIESLMCPESNMAVDDINLRHQWMSLSARVRSLYVSNRSGNEEELQSILDSFYNPPQQKFFNKTSPEEELETTVEMQQKHIKKLTVELIKTYNTLVDTTSEMNSLLLENVELDNKMRRFQKLQNEVKTKTQIINELKQKLASLCPRNVNKKLKRKDEKIEKIKREIKRKTEIQNRNLNALVQENVQLENELKQVQDKVKHIQIQKQRDVRMKSYYKVRLEAQCAKQDEQRKQIEQSEIIIKELQVNLNELQDSVDELQEENKNVSYFKNGKYTDEIRQVYMDLLAMGVSIDQCKNVVRSVLKNLVNVDVDRLPAKSLASIIAIEAHVLSQSQAAEAMLEHEDNCLHLDGTKKRFNEYAGFQVTTSDGSFSLSHQLMPSGDADSYLAATNETFDELAESVTTDACDIPQISNRLKKSIKNVMSDRHVVNKSYRKLLQNEKLKAITDLDGNLSDAEKMSAAKINGIYCGLHILPNMATAALQGLKNFESCHDIANQSIFQSNSVANNLIYEICKAFIETSGCQKSGDAADFNDYLSQINVKNKLVTFLHNRFNVLFIDGGAVFYHRQHILDFLSSGQSSKNNKLLTSILENISNETLLAECRALGIVGKIVCGPLWRLLENPNISYLGMNPYWQILVDNIEELSVDASRLLNGGKIFDDVEHDADVVSENLFANYHNLDNLTTSALQMIFSSILPMLKRQLSDQLPDGSLYLPNTEILTDLATAPKTNRISEADFSALDRIDRKAPQKSRSAKSGTITYTVNKTGKYIFTLSEEKKKKYFSIARRVASQRSKQDQFKKKEVRRIRLLAQQRRVHDKQRRAQKKLQIQQNLHNQMKEEGIWVNENDIKNNLRGKTKVKSRLLIRNQILFHSKILKSKIPNKSCLKFQENKEKYSNEKLEENLRSIINHNFSESIPDFVLNINTQVSMASRSKISGTCRTKKQKTSTSQSKQIKFEIDKFYAVAFTDAWYPGRCVEIIDDAVAKLDFLHPSGHHFRWPDKPDVQIIHMTGTLSEVTILPISNGRLWSVIDKNVIDNLF